MSNYGTDVFVSIFDAIQLAEAGIAWGKHTRVILAISAVMGSQKLPFPNGVFDLIHCHIHYYINDDNNKDAITAGYASVDDAVPINLGMNCDREHK
ncbi:hypothetical protein RYX36_011893 [Vicia faba]